MTKDNSDDGVIAALILRFERYRLPRALRIKERVDAGGALTDADIEHLKKLLEGPQQIAPLIERNPKCQDLVTKAILLYKQITEKALENEQNS